MCRAVTVCDAVNFSRACTSEEECSCTLLHRSNKQSRSSGAMTLNRIKYASRCRIAIVMLMSVSHRSSPQILQPHNIHTILEMEDHHVLDQSFSRLSLGHSRPGDHENDSRAVTADTTSMFGANVEDHAFQPDLQCSDLSDRFVPLRVMAENDHKAPVQFDAGVQRRSRSQDLKTRSRAYRITGLSSLSDLYDSAEFRRQWCKTTRSNVDGSSSSESDAAVSSPCSSDRVSLDLAQGLSSTEANRRFQLEAQTRWESSRKKRHSMSGYPSKEQYWARKTSKVEIGIEYLRKSHREAQRMVKRKGKMVVDPNSDSEGEEL